MTTQLLQYNQPLFVRHRHRTLKWKGKEFTYNDYFPWQELYVPENVVKTLFDTGMLYHNPDLEKESKVGDRLAEMNSEDLLSLVRQCNAIIKKRATTNKEYEDKKIKQSKLDDKQRGLIRAWLYRNAWMQEDYYKIRDYILDSKNSTSGETEAPSEEEPKEPTPE